jgi:hypothetical protein
MNMVTRSYKSPLNVFRTIVGYRATSSIIQIGEGRHGPSQCSLTRRCHIRGIHENADPQKVRYKSFFFTRVSGIPPNQFPCVSLVHQPLRTSSTSFCDWPPSLSLLVMEPTSLGQSAQPERRIFMSCISSKQTSPPVSMSRTSMYPGENSRRCDPLHAKAEALRSHSM